jgi:hypothetical protein
MRKFHIDMLERIDRQEGRSDALGLNAFFSNQLEQIRPTLYEKKYPELKARKAVPIKNDIHPGAMSLTERAVDEVGEADFISDLGDDANFVEVVKDQEDTYYMRMIALKYGWTIQEMRNAQFANMNLDTRKAFACRRGIERFIDKNLLIGGSVGGRTLYGLYTLSGAVAPLTFAGDLVGDFKDQSAEDLFRNLMKFATYVRQQTKNVEDVDTLHLCDSLRNHLLSVQMGYGSKTSVLANFLEAASWIKNVETSTYLEPSGGHGGTTNARFAIYRKDPEVLEGLVNEFEQLPPEYKGMRVETTCLARVGGVKVRLPKAIAYWDVASA